MTGTIIALYPWGLSAQMDSTTRPPDVAFQVVRHTDGFVLGTVVLKNYRPQTSDFEWAPMPDPKYPVRPGDTIRSAS